MSETNEKETGEVLPVEGDGDQAAVIFQEEAGAVEAAEEADLPVDEATSVEEEAAEEADGAEAAEAAEEAVDEEAPDAEPESASEAADEPEEDSPVKKAKGVGDLVAVGILSLILGVLLCMPYFLKGAGNSDYDLSEGVAATVNGVAIGEKEITDYVAGLRSSMSVADDAAWAEWMSANGYTPETVRSAVIQYYVSQELQKQAIAENDISVSDEEVEEQLNEAIEQFGGQEAFEEALADQGADLDMYRDSIRMGLQQQELAKKVAQDAEPVSDDQILAILKAYYPDEVAEDATTLEGLDEELVSYVREALESSAVEQAYSTWMQDYEAQATIEITDMPEGLPYNVELGASGQDASGSEEANSKE